MSWSRWVHPWLTHSCLCFGLSGVRAMWNSFPGDKLSLWLVLFPSSRITFFEEISISLGSEKYLFRIPSFLSGLLQYLLFSWFVILEAYWWISSPSVVLSELSLAGSNQLFWHKLLSKLYWFKLASLHFSWITLLGLNLTLAICSDLLAPSHSLARSVFTRV